MIYLFLDSKEVLHKLYNGSQYYILVCKSNLTARYMKLHIFEQLLLSC